MEVSIEMFVLDNVIANYLIVRIASALSNLPLHPVRSWIVSLGNALIAVCAFCYGGIFVSFPAKIAICVVSAIPMVFRGKDLCRAIGGSFCAAILVGGILYTQSFWLGGGYSYNAFVGTIPARVFLLFLLLLLVLPRWIRKWVSVRKAASNQIGFMIDFNGNPCVLKAFIDSGNLLKEPLTSKGVVIIRPGVAPPSVVFDKPIPYMDIKNGGVIHAAKPNGAYIDLDGWRAVDVYVAVGSCEFQDFDAVIPADIIPPQ